MNRNEFIGEEEHIETNLVEGLELQNGAPSQEGLEDETVANELRAYFGNAAEAGFPDDNTELEKLFLQTKEIDPSQVERII